MKTCRGVVLDIVDAPGKARPDAADMMRQDEDGTGVDQDRTVAPKVGEARIRTKEGLKMRSDNIIMQGMCRYDLYTYFCTCMYSDCI